MNKSKNTGGLALSQFDISFLYFSPLGVKPTQLTN